MSASHRTMHLLENPRYFIFWGRGAKSVKKACESVKNLMQFNATDMYPNIATVITTAISPQFWGNLLRIELMFNRSKTRLITSVQNWTHLTHLNFGVSTSAHNCAYLCSAQNCAQQNYGVNITQPKTWLSTSPFW